MEKIKLIFDTDMGMDCDDVGALSVLHNLADEGLVDILVTTHCGSEVTGAVCLKAINSWYNRPDIPVGLYKKRVFLEEQACKKYTEPVTNQYLKSNPMPQINDSVKLLRETLEENENVTLLVVGMLNNIEELLKSTADEISPLNGVELIEKKVDCMYVMGGNFTDPTFSEYNIMTDITAAKYVSENFPKRIIYCGFEMGENILTGDNLYDMEVTSPVRMAYYSGKAEKNDEKRVRASWDPVTAYFCVNRNSKLVKESNNCKICFGESGRTVISDGGKDCYLIAAGSEMEIQKEVNRYIK